MKISKRIYILLILIFLAFSKPTSLAPRLNGKIIYQSVKDGNVDLFSIDVNGGNPIRLTDDPANDRSPTYISATNQIGFVSTRQEGWILNLYSIDTDGKNFKAVTSQHGLELDNPDWSDDGKYIVVSLFDWRTGCGYTVKGCNYDIYTLSSSGTNFKNITNSSADDWAPDWSPDGKKIVFASGKFSSGKDSGSEIYVMDKDGSNLIQLTNSLGYNSWPRWSPDGKKISFETNRNKGEWSIYVMNSDGSNPIQITYDTGNENFASWSPDGDWLVYRSDKNGDQKIYVVAIDGHSIRQVTDDSSDGTKKNFYFSPIWIP